MNWLVRGLTSSVGLKFLMALTGLILFLFTVGHMVGNLQVFRGAEPLNKYAEMLQNLGPLLWVVRIFMLSVLAVHVICALKLTSINRAARPAAYEMQTPIKSTLSSRTMLVSGLFLLAFLVYHLAHFTLGVIRHDLYALKEATGRHDVHAMVVKGFQDPAIAIPYIVAMLLLGLHLLHGAASFFQSLGWNHRRYKAFFAGAARAIAMIVVAGNIAMPLFILLGIYHGGGHAP